MYLYDSLYGTGEAEYIVEKSRFIAHACPVTSFDEGKAFAAGIRAEYRDATHNVPAIICGMKQEMQWASDDGEPGGTSGLPVLKMIAAEGLTNLAVVITRYFGGIKLGTGGLSRAYTMAARLGIEAAGICEVRESCLLTYEFDYSMYSPLVNLSGEGSFEITDPKFTDVVTAEIRCMSETADSLKQQMNNMSGGKARLISETSGIIRLKK